MAQVVSCCIGWKLPNSLSECEDRAEITEKGRLSVATVRKFKAREEKRRGKEQAQAAIYH
jgi:hypothetical protein